MAIKQISVFLENKPGSLLEFTKLLKDQEINMKALSLAELSEYGVARVIVEDTYNLMQLLKEEGYIAKISSVLAIAVSDKPGSLVAILDALGSAEINVEYTYAFTSRKQDEAYIILKVNNLETAESALSKAGIKLLDADDVENL